MVIILKEKKDKSFNICLILFRLISVVIIIICLILLYNWHKENTENSSLSDELSDSFITATSEVTPKSESDTSENSSTTYESIEVNFEDLLSQNPQTVGWIKVNNTNINFPIVQSQDNNFYLKHNFKKNYNSAGWIFADYTNNFDILDENTIIYGHNRQNGTMFSNLKFLLKQDWFNDDANKTFIFNTKNNKYIAQIFSVYKISKNNLTLNTSFENETDFAETITSWKESSVCSFDITPNYKDNIITLCTCDNNTQYRIVVHAKLINVD